MVMIQRTTEEKGGDACRDDERKKDAVVRNAVKRLERLGYKVTVEAAWPLSARLPASKAIFGGGCE
jgi:hypothetical protein